MYKNLIFPGDHRLTILCTRTESIAQYIILHNILVYNDVIIHDR